MISTAAPPKTTHSTHSHRKHHLWRAAPLGAATGSQIQSQNCSCGPQLPQEAVAPVLAPKEVPLLGGQFWGGVVLEEQVELLG